MKKFVKCHSMSESGKFDVEVYINIDQISHFNVVKGAGCVTITTVDGKDFIIRTDEVGFLNLNSD